MNLDSTIVVCAHNEEDYIRPCLDSLLVQTLPPNLILVVADRCTDETVNVAREVLSGSNSTIIEKKSSSWHHSISENLEIARHKAVGDGLFVVDADMTVPHDFVEKLLPQLAQYASVSAVARTDPSQSLLNKAVSLWEKTYSFAPLGQESRGGPRAISHRVWERLADSTTSRPGILTSKNDSAQIGLSVKLNSHVVVLHRRKITLRRSIRYQIEA